MTRILELVVVKMDYQVSAGKDLIWYIGELFLIIVD